MSFRIPTPLPATFVLVWLCGCGSSGPELAPVTGILTKGDAPVVSATVSFYPDEGRPSVGTTDESGKFSLSYTQELEGAVVGSHSVSFSLAGGGPPPPPAGESAGKVGRRQPSGMVPPETVEWTEKVTVEPDGSVFLFEL